MMGQAKLMEIIDQAYDNAEKCENCKALAKWWDQHGAEIPTPGAMLGGRKGK